ncbi:DUF2459 domain-containing protein [Terricaulis sp.]|uniref:DUF2459 domain-containing protein n=1 Tax=Terricaulis sp. TaxID=2768686 RepID=UPI0037840CD9
MSIPGETAERRQLTLPKRWRLWSAAGLTLALLAYLYIPLPAPNVPQATRDDCVLLHLYSNGFHSDIGAPADIFPADHPLRRLYPNARSFLIGWGDEKFYYSDGTNIFLALDAVIPPSPTVLHIAYNAGPSSIYLGPNDDVDIAVSHEGAQRFVDYVNRALVVGDDGLPVIVSTGKVVGRSSFLRSRGNFHLFNVCNHWMARALRAAGVDVNARSAWFAGPLIRNVHHRALTSCPA